MLGAGPAASLGADSGVQSPRTTRGVSRNGGAGLVREPQLTAGGAGSGRAVFERMCVRRGERSHSRAARAAQYRKPEGGGDRQPAATGGRP